MSVCSQDLSIAIADLHPLAWYPGEAAGGFTPIEDTAGSADMGPSSAGGLLITTSAGRVALALTGNVVNPDIRVSSPSVFTYTGTDINIVGWTFMGTPTDVNMAQHILFPIGGANAIPSIDFFGDGTWSVTYGIPPVLVAGVIPLNAFFFWRIHYNAATQKFGVSINNGPVTYQPGITPLVNAAGGSVSITFDNSFAGANLQKLDELAVFHTALTDADLANLYNGGLGRTWP